MGRKHKSRWAILNLIIISLRNLKWKKIKFNHTRLATQWGDDFVLDCLQKRLVAIQDVAAIALLYLQYTQQQLKNAAVSAQGYPTVLHGHGSTAHPVGIGTRFFWEKNLSPFSSLIFHWCYSLLLPWTKMLHFSKER